MSTLKRVKTMVASASNVSGMTGLLRRVKRYKGLQQAVVLMYHRLRKDESEVHPFYQGVMGPAVEMFERQMAHLRRHYTVMPLHELVSALQGGSSLSPNAVAITFDDGYRDTYTLAYPILKKYELPATVFLATGFVESGQLLWYDRVAFCLSQSIRKHITLNGTSYPVRTTGEKLEAAEDLIQSLKQIDEDYKLRLVEELQEVCGIDTDAGPFNLAMSWDEVREMAHHGISFGAHTVTHPILTRVPHDVAKSELMASKATIENEILKPVNLLAYPNGQAVDFNDEVRALAQAVGFDAAFTTLGGPIDENKDLLSLNRVDASYDEMPIFKARLAGLFELIRPIKNMLM